MNGILQFTLGLTSGGFISQLGAADTKLKSFVGGMIGLGAIVAGVSSAIEKGAGLKKLSDQTGTSVANLYLIQRGLKAVGLDSGDAANMMFQLNKSMGGVNESGEPTSAIFAQIGLTIDGLKKLNAPQQLLAIGTALNKLDNSSATFTSSKIFGRYSAREFLQLSRNADEFADALRRGGTQAAIFDRFGRTFEKIEILSGQVKEKLSGIFLGIAAGIGPGLENVLKMLNNVDLSGIGAQIGTFITALTQAFREGKFSELIADSLKVGFDSILAFAPAIFEKVGFFLLKAFETPLEYIQAAMEYALEFAAHKFATSPAFNAIASALLGPAGSAVLDYIGDTGAPDWKQIVSDNKQSGAKFDLGSGEYGPEDINADANDRFKTALDRLKGEYAGFGKEVLDFAHRAPQPDKGPAAGAGKESLGAVYTPERTALEKMGFVFRNGAGSDPQTQTARNTAKMATTLQSILQKMGGTGSFRDTYANSRIS